MSDDQPQLVSDGYLTFDALGNPIHYTEPAPIAEPVPDRVPKPITLGYIETDSNGNAKFVGLAGTYTLYQLESDALAVRITFQRDSNYSEPELIPHLIDKLTDPVPNRG